jgi:hypothetical protein
MLFVTAFRNINRSSWTLFRRELEEYYSYFMYMARHLEYPLIAFLESETIKALQKFGLPATVEFVDINSVNTFYDEFLESERRIISSPDYIQKIPVHMRSKPEYRHPEYNTSVHSKPNFLKAAMGLHPEHDFYVWVDFGIVRSPEFLPRNVPTNLPVGVHVGHFWFPDKRLTDDEVLTLEAFLAGGQIVVHRSSVNDFEMAYRRRLELWRTIGHADDDQSVIYQLYYDEPGLIQLHKMPDWFWLFKTLVRESVGIYC